MFRLFPLGLLLVCLSLFLVLPSQEAAATAPTATGDTVRLSLTAPAPTLVERQHAEGTFTAFEGAPSLAGEPGMPALPVIIRLVGLPSADAPLLAVTLAEPQPLPRLPHPVEPVPQQVPVRAPDSPNPVGDYLSPRYVPDAALYAADAWYPAEPVTVGTPERWRGQPVVPVRFTPVQVNLATGEARYFARADVTLTPTEGAAGVSAPDDPHFEAARAAALANAEQARAWRQAPAPAEHLAASPVDDNTWLLTVEGDGLFRIALAELQAAGVPTGNPDRLALYRGLRESLEEQAIWIDGGYLYFVNLVSDSRWSTQQVYRLTVLDSGTGRRMETVSSAPNQPTTRFVVPYDLHYEQDLIYWSKDAATRPGERWFWKTFTVVPAAPTDSLLTTFDLPHLQSTIPFTAQVRVDLGPINTYLQRCHGARAVVNDQYSVTRQWTDNFEGFNRTLEVPSSALQPTGNSLRVEQFLCDGSDTLMFSGFTVTYQRDLVADANELRFTSERAPSNYAVRGFTRTDLVAFDVTDPDHPKRLVDGQVTGTNGYTFSWGTTGETQQEYLVTSQAAAQSVTQIEPYVDRGLRNDLSQADYLIITHPAFADALQPLVQRRSEDYAVRLVTTDAIYNDFGDGTMHPAAIKAFLRHAYQSWQPPAPAYVLLVGDATYDPLDLTGNGTTVWLPPMLVDKDIYIGEIPSDHAFVTGLEPDDPPTSVLADMFVGRLPANSPESAAAMVQKILRYEDDPFHDWRRRVLFTADDPDSAGDFHRLSDRLTGDVPEGLDLIPDRIELQKAYLRQEGSPYQSEQDVRDVIVRSLNEGLLLLQYIGHAGPTQWAAQGGVWNIQRPTGSDAALLSPSDALPLALPWTCWEGYFIYPQPDRESMSETMLRLPDRGVIGSFSPTGLDIATGHDAMAVEVYRALFGDQPVTQLGPLTTNAKLPLVGSPYERLMFTYVLFGDPALALKVPPCVYDENATCRSDIYQFLPVMMSP